MVSLEKGKAVEILLGLLEGPMHFTELQSKVGGSLSTIQQRVEELVAERLIVEREEEKFPFKRMLKLSDAGVSVARHLQSVRSIAARKPPRNREKWILAIIHALGEVKGSTRLEKLIFLLENRLNLADYAYTWYKHGPYSPEVLTDAKELADSGLLETEDEIFGISEEEEDYKKRVNYKLTPNGQATAAKLFDQMSESEKRTILSLRKYNMAPLKMLLEYIYSEYSPKDSEAEAKTRRSA